MKSASVTGLQPQTLQVKVGAVHTIYSRYQSFNTRATIHIDRPLAPLTSFKTGGAADLMIEPRNADELAAALSDIAQQIGTQPFILGGGANIVVSDAGVREPVVRLSLLDHVDITGTRVRAGAGSPISSVAA